jgi:hypothetical protein
MPPMPHAGTKSDPAERLLRRSIIWGRGLGGMRGNGVAPGEIDTEIHRKIDGEIDRKIDGQIGREIDGEMDREIDGAVEGQGTSHQR